MYLVTGAAGFIGWKTAELLLDQGHEVVGIDNLNHYYDTRIKTHRLEKLRGREAFAFFEVDVEDLDGLRRLFESQSFEAVLNLAARAGVRASMEDPFVYLQTNATGTLNLLELMRTHEVKKLVLASTSSLYAGQAMPFVETLPVNTPISPYAASKKAAEVMAYTYHYLYHVDVSITRFFTVYGPAGRPDMSVFRFIRWIDEGTPITLYGDGSQARDFTYVDDIADGVIRALRPVGYEIFNLGGGADPISITRMIEMLEELLGKKAIIDQQPFHQADMKVTWANVEKAREQLGWEVQVPFEEGLRRTVTWYQENRSWLTNIQI